MVISRDMELRRPGYVVMFVILLCALAIASSDGRGKTVGTVVGDGGGCIFTSPELDGHMDEQACMKELAAKEDAAGEFVHCIPKDEIHEAVKILPPKRKREFFDCLRKKSMLIRPSSERPSFMDWIIELVELIYGGPNIPRRHLISYTHHALPNHAAARAALSPSPSPSPVDSRSSPVSNSPPPSGKVPTNSRSSNHHSPVKAPASPSTPKTHVPKATPAPKSHPHAPSSHQQSKRNDYIRIVAFTTAVAAAVGLTIALGLLLFCCGGKNRVDPKFGQRDERPLLHISLSELSGGSSQKSFGFGNSTTKEFADNGNKPSLVGSLSNGASNADGTPPTLSGLKPPPGRFDPEPPLPAPAPPPPPPPAPKAPPPPPGKVARPPPVPSKAGPPLGPRRGGSVSDIDGNSGSGKTKLKPFFWDKVLASPDQAMVWHEISDGSFQFSEEMIESLFGYSASENKSDRRRETSGEPLVQYIHIIDAKKAQNLSILLKALNVTSEEVVEALQEGTLELPVELLQTLLKMAPTAEEELKLRLFAGDLSQLGPAERFLKLLVDTPFAFKRLESLLFMISMEEDMSNIRESFATLEVASKKLRNSRLFLKLLEAVLKTGNRMNDGTYRGGAQAFKLDTLLKLADVRGTDGKTTLLHFVILEIIRSEGIRAARSQRESRSQSSIASNDSNLEEFADDSVEHYRQLGLQVVSGLSTELRDVKRAAAVDADNLTATISKLGQSLIKTKRFLNAEMESLDEDSKFRQSLAKFVEKAETDISWISEEEKKIMSLVKGTVDYFHGSSGKEEGLRLFTIVRDFLIELDKSCKQVKEEIAAKQARNSRKETPKLSASSPQNSDVRQRLFPAIAERRIEEESSSSDDESSPSSS